MAQPSSSWLIDSRVLGGLDGEPSTGCGTRSALEMQRGLCFFQWALWQSLPQYLTRPQREQLDILGSTRSQLAQAPASSLEEGFFFIGMALSAGVVAKGGLLFYFCLSTSSHLWTTSTDEVAWPPGRPSLQQASGFRKLQNP